MKERITTITQKRKGISHIRRIRMPSTSETSYGRIVRPRSSQVPGAGTTTTTTTTTEDISKIISTQAANMSWPNAERWFSSLLEPSLFAIIVTALIALTVPLLLHLIIYRSSGSAALPSFLLIGPSGSGKTALLTLVGILILLC